MWDFLSVYLSDPEAFQLDVQYMARAIQEDAPAANRFVNTMVEESEAIFRDRAADGTMRPSSDPRALAVFNVMVNVSTLTMAPPLARALGHEHFGPEVLRRMAAPILELFVHEPLSVQSLLTRPRKVRRCCVLGVRFAERFAVRGGGSVRHLPEVVSVGDRCLEAHCRGDLLDRCVRRFQ